jgi:aminoglycoside 3-N-acetyltransferase
MYTKNDLKNQLKNMGLTGNETILIHSSMKSIGDVQDRAEGCASSLSIRWKTGW